MTPSIYIEVGESPKALIDRYGQAVDVNDKNDATYGVSFYSIDWPAQSHGSVLVKNGASELPLDTVLGVMGSYDKTRPEEGLSSYRVSMGLPPRNSISHDQARLKLYEMLGQIQMAGWKWRLYDTEPRLAGAESIRRLLQTSTSETTLDPSYIPTFSEWMALKDGSSWLFYKDKIYMDVQMSRDAKRMDPNLPGAYFVSIALESYASKWRALFDEPDRLRWRELLVEEKKKAAKERANAEQKLLAYGYHINTGYHNPDEEFDPTSKPVPVISDEPASHNPAPTPKQPSSLKEKAGRWFKGE